MSDFLKRNPNTWTASEWAQFDAEVDESHPEESSWLDELAIDLGFSDEALDGDSLIFL